MKHSLAKVARKQEFYIALILLALGLVIGGVNPAFFARGNLFSLLRSSVVMGIFALGVMIVLISGGIDISFPAIAVFSMYVSGTFLVARGYTGGIWIPLMMSAVIGMCLGSINAVFVAFFKLPTLIVSLGTLGAIAGFLHAFIGTRIINRLPQGMIDFSRLQLFQSVTARGQTVGLSVTIFFYVAIIILVAVLMKYTTLGRGIYALGGDRVAAERAGFNVVRTQFFIYMFVGLLAGMVGVIHATHVRNMNPFDLIGRELDVIAATVVGGTNIGGGKGTVIGTVLGVFLIVTMNNSLILLGIPSYWQRLVTGLIIIVATGISAYNTRKVV